MRGLGEWFASLRWMVQLTLIGLVAFIILLAAAVVIEALGWEPRVELLQGLEKTVAYMRCANA